MAHLHPNKNIKTQIVFVLKEPAGLDGVEDSINITCGILDYSFQILDTEDVSVKQIMPCLAILSQKSENDIAKHHQKNIILQEKLTIIWKNSKWPWEITSRFLKRRERRKATGHVGIFCQNLSITAYTLANYSNFKSQFSFNNGNIFKIHDYFRISRNAKFKDLSQLINTLSLSNQDFASLNNFNKLLNLFSTQGVARRLTWCS